MVLRQSQVRSGRSHYAFRVHAAALVGGTLDAVAARINAVGAGGDPSSVGLAWQRSVVRSLRAAGAAEHSALDGLDWWVLALASLVALLALGGAARGTAQRLMRRSTPELVVLLDQSAAFYGRWAEDELASVPRSELQIEAARCRRIVVLLEGRAAADLHEGPAERGPIAGLQVWITLLGNKIASHDGIPTGPAYA